MDKSKILKIAEEFSDLAVKSLTVRKIVLYGSYAKGLITDIGTEESSSMILLHYMGLMQKEMPMLLVISI